MFIIIIIIISSSSISIIPFLFNYPIYAHMRAFFALNYACRWLSVLRDSWFVAVSSFHGTFEQFPRVKQP